MFVFKYKWLQNAGFRRARAKRQRCRSTQTLVCEYINALSFPPLFLYTKMIVWARQARDKHTERNLKKRGRFFSCADLLPIVGRARNSAVVTARGQRQSIWWMPGSRCGKRVYISNAFLIYNSFERVILHFHIYMFLLYSKWSVYQDRLGTKTGKAKKRRGCFLQGNVARFINHSAEHPNLFPQMVREKKLKNHARFPPM